MIGCIDIEFRPGKDVVPRILEIIDEQGFTLRGLRLIPCCDPKRSTLKVDLGTCSASPEMVALSDLLIRLTGAISVIHGAKTGAPAAGSAISPR